MASVVNLNHPDFYMLMELDHVEWMGDTTVRHLGDMHQTILMDADIDEGTEVGDIGDDTRQYHSFFEIVDGSNVLVELEFF